ncbi:hypothetical protein, partial [Pseudomonas oryzihabitans]|uniref:hypothetical protein n=1 Tax=Pseudomonas oryzihabitans TaxID=47885 RepID=UPI00289C7216
GRRFSRPDCNVTCPIMRSFGYGVLHRVSAFSRWRLTEIRYRLASLANMTASGIQIAAYRTPAPQIP